MGEYANKAIGKTKRTVGRVTRNRSLQAKGMAQEYTGKAQGAAKDARRTVRRGAKRAQRKVASSRPARKARSAGTRRQSTYNRF